MSPAAKDPGPQGAGDWSIEKLKAMDPGEWERLQRELFSRVYFFIRRQVGDPHTSEDLTQETFLGAVRGMDSFDPRYTVEQFLFGIARNRVVDHFRRKRPILMGQGSQEEEEAEGPGLDRFPGSRRSPEESALVREEAGRRREVMAAILKDLVSELWEAGDYEKLKVLEFLFAMGGRNKEAARRFAVRDEKAVAGIKFRALERLRALARSKDPNRSLFKGLWEPGAR